MQNGHAIAVDPAVRSLASEISRRHNLYGRDQQVSHLLEGLDRTTRGRAEVLLLPGLSGAGKTALANTLRGPARAQNGFFLEGKFNQYDQNVAYVAWRQALGEFCNFVGREEQAVRDRWAAEILEAVAGQGQLLIDLVPEFERLLGKQAPVDTISPQESRHRFAGVIRDTLAVIAQPEHPLVLFIDDWQWADPASLHLLTQLQFGSTLRYVLLVAAYRSDEVEAGHGFHSTVAELRSQQIPLSTTPVEHLTSAELQCLVAAEQEIDACEARALAEDVFRATGGNAFFAHVLLGAIRSDNHPADCEPTAARATLGTDVPTSVVDLFTRRISGLPERTQELLSLAACLGHRFDLDTLAMIGGWSIDECQSGLAPARGMLTPLSDKVPRVSGKWFRFAHDRVQQAAFSRIPPGDLAAIRLMIARQMLAHLSTADADERVCEIADHFNAGAGLIDSEPERLRGVELNMHAARKARNATAFRSALAFHRAARTLLASGDALPRFWRQHHDTALALHLEHAETEFLEGDQGEAEELIRQAVQNAQTPTQRADALTALVVQHTLQARYGDAIATGREALATIGFELPDERFEEARDTAIQETQRLMAGRSVDDIVGMPLASDQVMQTAAKILITMGPPCYRAHQRLWSVIVPRVVNLTLQYGHIPQIGYSHPAMAGLLGWVSDDFESGRVYCKIASRLMNPDLAPASDQSVYHLMMGSSARHWYGPLSESTEDYLAAIESGRASGNLQYAAYSLGHNMYCRFFQGTPLAELTAETEGALSFSRTRHNQWAIDLLRGGLRVFGALAGGTPADASEDWEAAYLQEVESHHNQQVACIYYVLKAQQCLLRGEADASHGYLQKAEPLIATVGTQGLLPWPEYVFTRAMTTAMSAGGAAGPLSSEQDAEAESLTSQLRVWAEQCPQNFRHKHLLVLAERAAAEGRRRDAMGLLDEAVDAAKESGFVHWEGFANRRAADLWGAIGNGRLQQVYWQRAYDCFGRWGAQGIIDGIDAEYHQSVMAAARDLDSCEATQTQAEEHQHQRFAKRHLGLLRESAAQLEQARQQQHVAETAEELATAADSLRVDVATGRRTVTKLRKQRKAEQALNQELECRVAERTAELEATSKELQLSERLFRTSVEAAPVGMVMINDEGAIVLANSSLCHLFGYEREELVGESIELLVPHACRTPHGSLQENGFREPDPRLLGVGRDLFGKHKHGTLIPIEFGLTPITLEDGAGAIGTVVDLTARKRAEDSLRESEERHRLVVDGVKDYSIISLDPAGAITTWNSGAERILGYCADEILGRHSSSFHPGDAVEAGQAELELSIAAAEGRFEDEGWRVRKDGKPFWANVVITAIRDSQGTLVGYSKITRDLTERRRAEQALEDANFSLAESQALLRTLIDESMNFKGVMTPDGTLIDANRTALTAAGVDAQDVLNRPFADTPWWSHSPELQQRLSEAILSVASGEADRFDATHLDPAGNVLHVDFSLKPVRNDAGEVIYLIPEGRDMTLHKQREEELHRLIEEVRRSNDELEQFAYVASHDLQEPLRKIASYCKLLKEEQSDKLDEEGNEYLDVAINGAKRLQTLVRDLLTFSRITTRGKPLTATSASASFADATTNLSMLIEERAAVITCEALPDVVADSGQLTHLFQNLIGNAIKYCDHQAPEIHVGVRDAGRAVEFFVRDNGIGIDPVFHEKIFQVFQRLHNRREYGGTGIGLALCKRIVERFGGTIRVESTAGAGSTFYFTTSKAEHENRADVPTRHAAPVGAAN